MISLAFCKACLRLAGVSALCAGLGLGAPAHAALVATTSVLERSGSAVDQAAAARARVQAFLARSGVRAQLEALGVSSDEARLRVAALSDTEVIALDQRLESLPAGESFIGFALGVIVVTFAVLVITDVLGLTDVFTFINPVSSSRAY